MENYVAIGKKNYAAELNYETLVYSGRTIYGTMAKNYGPLPKNMVLQKTRANFLFSLFDTSTRLYSSK